jgi:KipI family sensor histidine kinase inhibitor
VRVLPYGDTALLAEPTDPASVLSLAAAARAEPGVVEVIPAARTLLVRTEATATARLARRLVELESAPAAESGTGGEPVVLDVRYDGADLAGVAAEVGLDPDEVIRRHSAGRYVVAFCGFAPGFAYLTGLDESLHVPRLAEPRTTVPAGSVAIAGEFTAVYPRASPGGWRLLGTTDAELWDLARTPPALLVPGTAVRFRPA